MADRSVVRIMIAMVTFAILTTLAGLAGCDEQKLPSAIQSKTEMVTQPEINVSVALTIGDHTWVPLNLEANPSDRVRDILLVLSAFEKAHQELEIVGWKIEKNQRTYNAQAYIYGLWIDHRPKK